MLLTGASCNLSERTQTTLLRHAETEHSIPYEQINVGGILRTLGRIGVMPLSDESTECFGIYPFISHEKAFSIAHLPPDGFRYQLFRSIFLFIHRIQQIFTFKMNLMQIIGVDRDSNVPKRTIEI